MLGAGWTQQRGLWRVRHPLPAFLSQRAQPTAGWEEQLFFVRGLLAPGSHKKLDGPGGLLCISGRWALQQEAPWWRTPWAAGPSLAGHTEGVDGSAMGRLGVGWRSGHGLPHFNGRVNA